ncbi:MAG: DeoR/GlpR family DNA-binding transcription regulator [Bacillota bacterium]|nr:DeoR/GlpR family DNA-binding transcription regulator [Bacillota bacterium]MDW7677240.1 DeoR/GlpR family DNA-binding transcription regulator [Bacillota bacterium]
MAKKRVEQIEELLLENKKISVNELSELFRVSAVSIRKDLSLLEKQGVAKRHYGGAVLASAEINSLLPDNDFHQDPLRQRLAEQACDEIEDGDCLFIGSGRTCCVLARKLDRFRNLTVVTNNITALQDLLKRVPKVYLIGGEVTSTDGNTLFSSWEQPQSFAESIYVNKAFTSISGIDLKAGLTVNSIISTYVFRHIPTMAHQWILLADHNKYDRIAIYPVASMQQIHTIISDKFPQHYRKHFNQHHIRMVLAEDRTAVSI